MPQGVLPIQYEIDPKERGLTALGGLPLYLELAHITGSLCAYDDETLDGLEISA